MKKDTWKQKIKRACEEAGTYQKCFDMAIDSLAGILEKRDQTRDQIEVGGEMATLEVITAQGNTNYIKNPTVVMLNDFEKTALAYWKELGLTPAGLKKINDDNFAKQQKTTNSLLELLEKKKK